MKPAKATKAKAAKARPTKARPAKARPATVSVVSRLAYLVEQKIPECAALMGYTDTIFVESHSWIVAVQGIGRTLKSMIRDNKAILYSPKGKKALTELRGLIRYWEALEINGDEEKSDQSGRSA